MPASSLLRPGSIWLLVKLLGYVAIPVVLLCLPADYFDNRPSICLSQVLFSTECYGCGMSRSMMHLIHGQWADAYYFNPLGFVVFPLLACQWASWALADWRKWQSKHQ